MSGFDNIWLSSGYCPICDEETRIVSAKHESYGHCIECGHRLSLHTISPASKKNEPEIWECRLMGEFIYPRQVEFSAEEVQMLREISWKTGVQRSEVIREAVRRLYDHIMYRE